MNALAGQKRIRFAMQQMYIPVKTINLLPFGGGNIIGIVTQVFNLELGEVLSSFIVHPAWYINYNKLMAIKPIE